MSITTHLKSIGRGKDGAKPLNREQATDLMAQILQGRVSDLELGAFCIAMRVKGETAQEMAGFLDAVHGHLHRVQATPAAPDGLRTVVLPTYNGARKLPLLTPLLACLLAREGCSVLVHGAHTEPSRITTEAIFAAMGIRPSRDLAPLHAGELRYLPLDVLHGGLQRLLMARRLIGLRNSGHSLVKLMNPVAGPALVVASYTHSEYLASMTEVLRLTHQTALLLRGTEGEAVADARRMPRIDGFANGAVTCLEEGQSGALSKLADPPSDLSAETTARFTEEVLSGTRPVPAPIARQVDVIVKWARHA